MMTYIHFVIPLFTFFVMDPADSDDKIKIKTLLGKMKIKTLLDNESFRRLLTRVIKDVFPPDMNDYWFREDAALLLQQQTELFLIEMFRKGTLNSKKWERDTVLPRDLIIGLWEMNFDYLVLSQKQKQKSKVSLMSLFKKYKK